MNEKLLRDFWLESGNSIYPDFEVEIQTVAGGVVIFREQQPEMLGSFEQHTVDLLDVIAWVYSKVDS